MSQCEKYKGFAGLLSGGKNLWRPKGSHMGMASPWKVFDVECGSVSVLEGYLRERWTTSGFIFFPALPHIRSDTRSFVCRFLTLYVKLVSELLFSVMRCLFFVMSNLMMIWSSVTVCGVFGLFFSKVTEWFVSIYANPELRVELVCIERCLLCGKFHWVLFKPWGPEFGLHVWWPLNTQRQTSGLFFPCFYTTEWFVVQKF